MRGRTIMMGHLVDRARVAYNVGGFFHRPARTVRKPRRRRVGERCDRANLWTTKLSPERERTLTQTQLLVLTMRYHPPGASRPVYPYLVGGVVSWFVNLSVLPLVSSSSSSYPFFALECPPNGCGPFGTCVPQACPFAKKEPPEPCPRPAGTPSSYCHCQQGYAGADCSLRVEYCRSLDATESAVVEFQCYNGGTCRRSTEEGQSSSSSWYCDCSTAVGDAGTILAGPHCEYTLWTSCHEDLDQEQRQHGRMPAVSVVPTHAYCVNGGTCARLVSPGHAHPGCQFCPPELEGRHCQYALGTAPLAELHHAQQLLEQSHRHQQLFKEDSILTLGFTGLGVVVVVLVVVGTIGLVYQHQRRRRRQRQEQQRQHDDDDDEEDPTTTTTDTTKNSIYLVDPDLLHQRRENHAQARPNLHDPQDLLSSITALDRAQPPSSSSSSSWMQRVTQSWVLVRGAAPTRTSSATTTKTHLRRPRRRQRGGKHERRRSAVADVNPPIMDLPHLSGYSDHVYDEKAGDDNNNNNNSDPYRPSQYPGDDDDEEEETKQAHQQEEEEEDDDDDDKLV